MQSATFIAGREKSFVGSVMAVPEGLKFKCAINLALIPNCTILYSHAKTLTAKEVFQDDGLTVASVVERATRSRVVMCDLLNAGSVSLRYHASHNTKYRVVNNFVDKFCEKVIHRFCG